MATSILSMSASLPFPVTESAPADAAWEERAWRAVLDRDCALDGSFVYAVSSTGIFCRPSCPSRRPERGRVRFFASGEQARHAGYRACLRCAPERAGAPGTESDRRVISAVLRALDRLEGERPTLAALSEASGLRATEIRTAFARALRTTPAQFLRERRLHTFREAMTPPAAEGRITDALYDAGFGSSSRLYEHSQSSLGMTPGAMRAGAPGERIEYILTESPLGRTLVAATTRGVCAIHFGDTDEALRAELRGRFSRATLVERREETGVEAAEEGPGRWLLEAVRFVVSQMTESPEAAAFPLHVRATAFQQRVWQALRAIPRGERTSYAALAKRLGQPSAARAVASACARNPVALAIPCHRVVSGTGDLAGYRWGLERKRRLLEAEQPTP